MSTVLPPAAKHLLAALGEPDTERGRTLGSLTGEAWSDVADLAIRQRVAGLTAFRLQQIGAAVPAGITQRLNDRSRTSALRALRLQAALRELATAVAPQGIDLIALKGMHLACTVYPHVHFREMSDVDILVREHQLEAVGEAAAALGYRPAKSGYASHHLVPRIRGDIFLELHHSIDARGETATIGAADLTDLEAATFSSNVKFLNTEDLLTHLCMHAADSHVFESGLRSVCDIQAVLAARGTAIRWDRVAHRAQQWSCARSIALVLALCRRELGVLVPAEATRRFPTPPDEILDAAVTHMFDTVRVPSAAAARFATARGIVAKSRIVGERIALRSSESRFARIAGLYRRHAASLLRGALLSDPHHAEGLRRRASLTQWLRNP